MTKPTSYTSQDKIFKSLQDLAENDPEQFEAKRDELINEFISDIPDKYQKGMHCLQWRIDRTRDLAKTPLAACIEISKMMYSSVAHLHKQSRAIHQCLSGETDQHYKIRKPLAKILEFRTSCGRSKMLSNND